jgi:FkbM family methyltransferase
MQRWWQRRGTTLAEGLRRWVWAPRPQPVKYGRARIWLHVTTEEERRYRLRAAQKEPWTIAWLESQVHPGDVVYDIGANVGVFSLIAAIARSARVIAFEPGFANYARLCENIHLNRCGDSITPMPWLLADRSGMRQFEYRSLGPGQSRHVMRGSTRPLDETERYLQPMAAIALDDAIRQFDLPVPTHIKLDVDGGEALVLAGARATLANPRLTSVIVEAGADTEAEVRAALEAAGLRETTSHRREHKPDAPWYGVFRRG